MGTPQKGYRDYKNRSGGVGWDTFFFIHAPLKGYASKYLSSLKTEFSLAIFDKGLGDHIRWSSSPLLFTCLALVTRSGAANNQIGISALLTRQLNPRSMTLKVPKAGIPNPRRVINRQLWCGFR